MARPPSRFLGAVPVIPQNLPPAWFSPEEYKRLYKPTRKRAQEPKKRGFKWEAEQLHDYVLFAVNTGLRPDQAWRLQFRDVTIVYDDDLKKTILEIEVRGKAWRWILQKHARCCVAL
jgi:integrase